MAGRPERRGKGDRGLEGQALRGCTDLGFYCEGRERKRNRLSLKTRAGQAILNKGSGFGFVFLVDVVDSEIRFLILDLLLQSEALFVFSASHPGLCVIGVPVWDISRLQPAGRPGLDPDCSL